MPINRKIPVLTSKPPISGSSRGAIPNFKTGKTSGAPVKILKKPPAKKKPFGGGVDINQLLQTAGTVAGAAAIDSRFGGTSGAQGGTGDFIPASFVSDDSSGPTGNEPSVFFGGGGFDMSTLLIIGGGVLLAWALLRKR